MMLLLTSLDVNDAALRGEIRLVDLAPARGSEANKRRPAASARPVNMPLEQEAAADVGEPGLIERESIGPGDHRARESDRQREWNPDQRVRRAAAREVAAREGGGWPELARARLRAQEEAS